MDLTIVIVNWNGGHLFLRCLESIRSHGGGRPVIIIDNDSKDGSREAAAQAFPEFRVMNSGANLGFGKANNLARSLAQTPLVLFLNPDTELMEGTLDRAAECMKQRPDVGALGCKMLGPDGKVQELGLQWPLTPWTVLMELLFASRPSRRFFRRWLPIANPRQSAYVRKIYGGFMLVRREILDTVGWFDERYFMYAEDADLSRTIVKLGWRLYYCAESAVVHVGGGSTTAAPGAFSILMMQESINKLIAKYQGPLAAVLHRAAVLTGSVIRLGAALLARLCSVFRRNSAAAASWEAFCGKQKLLAFWALGLKRACVPDGRRAGAPARPAEASPLTCQVFEGFAGLDRFRAAWDEAVAAASGSVYMTYDWARLWWQFYGASARLKVFLFWSAERLVAVVPIYVETLGAGPVRFRVARLVGANIPPRVFNPPVPDQYATEVFAHILTELFTRSDCDFLSFGPVSESECMHRALTAACSRLSARVGLRRPARTVHTVYDLPGTMEEYYQGLSKNERKHRKKFELRLLKSEYADARVELVSDPAHVVEEFDRFAEQHREQWSVKHRLGHFGSWPRAFEFHRALVTAQAELGRVRFLRIVAGGEVIARKYLFVFGDRYYAELNARSVDPKWDRFSLGPSGAVNVIQLGIAEGMKRVESGLEHYDHKASLGAKEYAAITSRIVNSRLRSRVCFVFFSLFQGCMRVGYHKIWYRRISPRLPHFFWRSQWRPWLRLDF